MDYREHIQAAIDYIEKNLTGEIDNSILASISGYSEYHFLRIFKNTAGMTPVEYIRKRRLSEIAYRMETSDQYLSEIAFEYGFNSKENFIRAFKREHHILPTEYKHAMNSLRLYQKIQLDTTPFCVEPEIVTLSDFTLTVYKSDEELPPHFWNKYNCRKLSKILSGGQACEDYGVSIWNGRLDYYIGIRSEKVKGSAAGTINIRIPGGTYAVFTTPETTHMNFVNMIQRTWIYINNCWLPGHGYRQMGEPEFETYTEESQLYREKIYIPYHQLEN